MHLRSPADHPSEEVGAALTIFTQQLTEIARSGRHLFFLLLERDDDQPPLGPLWYCSFGGSPLGTSQLDLPDLYQQMALSSPVPDHWPPFDQKTLLQRSLPALQQALGYWEEATGLANFLLVRTQNPGVGSRYCRRFVNGKPVPPENDDQDDFDLIKTLIGVNPSQPIR